VTGHAPGAATRWGTLILPRPRLTGTVSAADLGSVQR